MTHEATTNDPLVNTSHIAAGSVLLVFGKTTLVPFRPTRR